MGKNFGIIKWLTSFLFFCSIHFIYSQDIDQFSKIADSVVSLAKSQLGVTYKWATCKPGESFDCSGLAYYAYHKAGVKSSRSSVAYTKLGKKIQISESKKGDCILFTGYPSVENTVGHIGIIIENKGNELYFIHCSSSKSHYGVVITEYYASNYPKRFIETRRLIK